MAVKASLRVVDTSFDVVGKTGELTVNATKTSIGAVANVADVAAQGALHAAAHAPAIRKSSTVRRLPHRRLPPAACLLPPRIACCLRSLELLPALARLQHADHPRSLLLPRVRSLLRSFSVPMIR